jgi:spore maturation protein CgeB
MRIAFYGSSLLSAYWNGAATYYRGLLRELASRGYTITFYEPDAFDRQRHRDIDPPDWATVVVYPATIEACRRVIADCADAEIVVKASGVGIFDDLLLDGLIEAAAPDAIKIFWDVDAPATLAEIAPAPAHPLRRNLSALDLVLTYGGGPPVVEAYEELGAVAYRPIYNGLDPRTHHPVPIERRFAGHLNFLANRLPDRERRVETFFLEAAVRLPDRRFILGGSGWSDKEVPTNVERLGHVGTSEHNVFNSSAKAVLNVARDSMAAVGYSPATRIFEAAGAGACIITDSWIGIDLFLKSDEEILVARDGHDVADLLQNWGHLRCRAIGEAARRRVLEQHTYRHRAIETDRLIRATFEAKRERRLA